MKDFADDNFKFVENGRMFSKQVENTVGKGKEKLLVTSNSPFLTMFSTLYGNYFPFLNALLNVVCNLFQFGPV